MVAHPLWPAGLLYAFFHPAVDHAASLQSQDAVPVNQSGGARECAWQMVLFLILQGANTLKPPVSMTYDICSILDQLESVKRLIWAANNKELQ